MAGIRLSKLTKELNVGLHTLVEFLNKKGNAVEANPNAKIDESEYELLLREFLSDKKEIDRRLQELRAPKTVEAVVEAPSAPVVEEAVAPSAPVVEVQVEEPKHIKVEVAETSMPQIKTVGKIDLEVVNRPSKKKEEEPVAAVEIPEVKKEVVVEAPAPAPAPVIKPEPKEEPQPVVVKKVPVKEKTEVKKEEKKEEVSAPEAAQTSVSEETPFRLDRPQITVGVNQVGFIDLSSMNHSTRPAKKSKEEKKKEREAKEQARHDKGVVKKEANADKKSTGKEDNNNDPKKKRQRIHREGNAGGASHPGGQQGPNRGNQNSHNNNNNNNNKHKHQNQFRRPEKTEVTEEDVQKQIKETLARLTNKPKKGDKYRREKRENVLRNRQEREEREERDSKVLKVTEFVTVNDLANMMDVSVIQVIQTCMSLGHMVSINQRLDAELISFVADEFGFKTEYVSAEVADAINEEEDSEEDLISRPPIVTVMGHVDHGKTSLLDYVRKANVIAGEAGGITQHIGAYHVELQDGRVITFLDTPGHAAFTAMRARGAKITDIAIIIVAADDSVMPQTVEAINHAAAANVPIVFAINKIDKPGANPEKIREALAGMNYLVEDWGGKYQCQEISAKKGLGIKELLEKVLLEAEMLELKANPNKRAVGSVVESTLDKGRGYVSTVMVQNGTLRQGDIVVAGTNYGRVKAMFNEREQRVTEAGPAEPVLILGLNGAPTAGDIFNVLDTEQEAREITTKREQLQREQSLRTQKMLTLEDIGRRLAIGNFQQLNIIVKGDVDGSVEALSDSLIKLSTEEIQVRVIHKAVGQISDSDVMLAATSDAIIIGFQVRPSASARKLAENEGVEIRHYSIIYDAIEEVKDAMEGMLSPEIKEEITATIDVREVFKITKVGTVAGCIVKEGKVKRANKVRLIRDGIVIYTGELESLKRFKEDVKEVATGYECGLNIKNYNDIHVGDLIEAYEEIEIKKTL